MKVRITHAGPHGSHLKGEVVDLPRDEAQRLVDANWAEPVAGKAPKSAPVETAAEPCDDVETR